MSNFERARIKLNVREAELFGQIRSALTASIQALLTYHGASPEAIVEVTNRFKVYLSFASIARDCMAHLADEAAAVAEKVA